MKSIHDALREACNQAGVVYKEVPADGRFHPADIADDPHGKGDGRIKLFPDGEGGLVANWKTGDDPIPFFIDDGRKLTDSERRERDRRREEAIRSTRAEEKKRRAEAAEQAAATWAVATPAGADHPYLTKKRVKPYGVRVHDGRLIVPVKIDGVISSLQYIANDGGKLFHRGGAKSRGFHLIGEARTDGVICIAEGYATAASIHEATGYPVAVAFDAGNLEPAAVSLRKAYPTATLIVCGDDDHVTPGNPGRTKAMAAAKSAGGVAVFPEFGADRPAKASDFNDMAAVKGMAAVRELIEAGKAKPRTVPEPQIEPTVPNGQAERDADPHRNQPKPTAAMLYGLAGDVGRTAAKDTEVNPYAACAGFLSFISAAMGRNAFLSVGNTRHHPRLFMLHVGRTGRGRKGDALALVKRIRNFLAGDNAGATSTVDVGAVPFPGQLHTGGLSTREGLALLLHDEMKQGKEEIPAIDDKRLWIIESEFENVLQQGKRDGNTLSSALRDAWDGESIRPAIKSARVWASDPHVAFSGAITPGELRTLLDTKAMTNGFANRFMIFWGERTGLVSRPKATPKAVMEALAMRTKEVIEFAKGDYPRTKDGFEFAFTAEASKRYDELYRGELNRYGYGALVDAILERRAPMLVRLAMILALTDRTRFIEVHHVDAALSWIQYFRDSVRFIFSDEGEFEAEEKRDVAEKIIEFLRSRGEATRTQFTSECFAGHVAGDRIDAALSDLLAETPPRIEIRKGPKSANNKRAKIYTLCEVRELGEAEGLKRFPGSSPACEVRELDQPTRPLPFSSSPSSQPRELPETPISPSSAPSSPTSQGIQENEPHDDGWCQI